MVLLRRHRLSLLLLVILLLAAALRFYRIDAQSFWHDEGNSAGLAQRDVARILAGAAGDIHPPGYYLLLSVWTRVVGTAGEAPYRSLSAVCGVALVAVVYAIGARLFGAASALIAALLVAVNPFQVYYAQEARMYALLALEAALAVWAVLVWLDAIEGRGSRALWAMSGIVVLVGVAGLFTHYLFPIMLLVQSAIFAGVWLAHALGIGGGQRVVRWSVLALWSGLQLCVLALYLLPWGEVAYRQISGWPAERVPYESGAVLVEAFRVLVFGPVVETANVTLGLAAAALLALFAWVPLRPAEPVAAREDGVVVGEDLDDLEADEPALSDEDTSVSRSGALGPPSLGLNAQAGSALPARGRSMVPLVWLLAPVGLVLGAGLWSPSFAKFLLVAQAALALLVAHGAANTVRIARRAVGMSGARWSPWAWLGMGALLAVFVASQTDRALQALYFDPAYARDDYRGIAARVRSLARPDDAVLFLAPNQWEVFTFYFPDDGRLYPLARQRPLDPVVETAELEAIAARHARLFVLYWAAEGADPEGFVERWLDAHAVKAEDRWYGGVRLAIYAVAPPATLEQALDARLGEKIALRGFALRGTEARPGDVLALDLFWEALAPVDTRYKVFVHLVGPTGDLVAQHDAEPGDTTRWSVGEQVVDRHGLLIPPDAAHGAYELRVGLYAVDGGERLPVTRDGAVVGEWVVLQEVRVER